MKYYINLICICLFFVCCSKTGNKTGNSPDLGNLPVTSAVGPAVAPENLRIKILGNKAIFLQPEDHFQYDSMGRVASVIDSFTIQVASANIYPGIPTYSGSSTVPVNISYYWTYWYNGILEPPNLTRSKLFSSNSSGQIVSIFDDSSKTTATFQYGNSYIVTKFFETIQSQTIYYDSAVLSADHDISAEYRIHLDDTLPATRYDTLKYNYTSYLNPEFYVSLFEYPAYFNLGVPLVVVSKHLPSSVFGTLESSTAIYSYQTDNQGRATAQMDGKGNIIKTYSYY